jgi:uncharacterized membrane protein
MALARPTLQKANYKAWSAQYNDVMKKSGASSVMHEISRIGFILKGIDGILECSGALMLLLVSPRAISRLVRVLTQHELSHDPTDFLASHLVLMAQTWSVRPKVFFALYLMVHGGVKIVLILGLLQRKLWVYPLAILFMLLLITYQLLPINCIASRIRIRHFWGFSRRWTSLSPFLLRWITATCEIKPDENHFFTHCLQHLYDVCLVRAFKTSELAAVARDFKFLADCAFGILFCRPCESHRIWNVFSAAT